MAKQPSFMFYTGDWLKDPKLAMCSVQARGIWIDLLCAMHEQDRSGQITGTTEQFARICRCTAVQFVQAADELKSTGTADVTERNGKMTVINRRMKREHQERKLNNERQLRFKQKKRKPEKVEDDGKITPYSSSSVSVSKNNESSAGAEDCRSQGSARTNNDKKSLKFSSESEPYRLSVLLFDLIRERKADFKRPNLQKWAECIERMIRLDKREPAKIEAVLRFCQRHSFWQNNILSTEKLREKFDRLELLMDNEGNYDKKDNQRTDGRRQRIEEQFDSRELLSTT